LIALLKQAIAADPFPLSARVKLLRGIGGEATGSARDTQLAAGTQSGRSRDDPGAVQGGKRGCRFRKGIRRPVGLRTDHPRPEFSDPDPLRAIGNRRSGVPVAKVAVEMTHLVLPADTITHAPLRDDASVDRPGSSGSLLAGFARFAPW